ncbi:MAG: PP2C family protein-serine/threonine phosphatase [Planctomycetota bacterium]
MNASSTKLGWLAALPRAVHGEVVVHVLEPGGDLAQRFAADGASAVPAAAVDADGRGLRATLDEQEFVLTPATGASDSLGEFLAGVVELAQEREQLQRDLEGMYPTSLALLEEASMWGDVLPTLPTGRTEEEVAETGARALVVASSAERVLYVRARPDGSCEILVHIVADGGGQPRAVPTPAAGRFVPGNGLVGQALRGSGAALLAHVDELKEKDGPESLAKRELIAVPVRYGTGANTHTLGVLLLMDKVANSYTSNTELSSQETKLAHAVAAMLGSVLGTRRVAELGKELETAQEIHRQIQTASSVKVAGFDIAGCNRACGTVGGDYFDFLGMADGRTLAALMDVSGHNLASGMLMVSARMSLRVLAGRSSSPGSVLTELGQVMHEDLMRTERFISAVGAALAPNSGTVELVNAGHLDTLVVRANGRPIDTYESEDVVLGFLAGTRYQGCTLELAAGDLLLLYTDGLTEACDADENMFGVERLCAVLEEHRGASAETVLQAVLGAADAFRGPVPWADDVTLVAIRACGPEEHA